MKNMICSTGVLNYLWLIILGILLVIGIILFCVFVPVKMWFRAINSRVFISPSKLYSLRARVQNYTTVVDWYIYAKKAGCRLTIEDLETHLAVGGDLKNVVSGLITAQNAQIHLSIDTAKSLDLSHKDVTKTVNDIINTKVLKVPTFSAWSIDSKQIKVSATITVRPILDRLLTGTMEDTLISRVQEALICGVGNSKNYKEVLQNVDLIAKVVLTKKLDKDSAFKILSIDIVNVELGRDLQHERMLEEKQNEAQMAVTRAEEQKELALAKEQEMKVKIQEKYMEKAEAEAEIPKSIVKAFEEGKIDMKEYWKMQNLIADTNMRKSLIENFKKDDDNTDFKVNDDDDDEDDDDDFDDLF